MTDAVGKHNERNPESAIIYLNYGAVDPVLTIEQCNFWHFRFDADAHMKMQVLTNMMATQTSIKKVYLINRDYAFGARSGKCSVCNARFKAPEHQVSGR